MTRHNADIQSTRRRNPHRSTRDMNSNTPDTGTQRHRCQFRYRVTSLAPIIQFLSILILRPFDNTRHHTSEHRYENLTSRNNEVSVTKSSSSSSEPASASWIADILLIFRTSLVLPCPCWSPHIRVSAGRILERQDCDSRTSVFRPYLCYYLIYYLLFHYLRKHLSQLYAHYVRRKRHKN